MLPCPDSDREFLDCLPAMAAAIQELLAPPVGASDERFGSQQTG
ncbi:MAG: hypothetical protein ACUVSQ_10130 [Pseudanabaenaceae cyanobacterium]